MKKIHLMGLAMFAVFAFGAIAASSAFAEDRWLIDGTGVTTLTSVQTSGTLILTDTKAPLVGEAAAECSAILDGTVGPAGEDEITEVLTLAGVAYGHDNANSELENAGVACTNVKNCPGALVWVFGLPWLTQLELVSTTFVDDFTSDNTAKLLGYELECSEQLGKPVDLCTQALFVATLENMGAPENDVLGTVNEPNKADCTLGGAASGSTVSGEAGLTSTLDELTLAVS
jgi:hypothetical protein